MLISDEKKSVFTEHFILIIVYFAVPQNAMWMTGKLTQEMCWCLEPVFQKSVSLKNRFPELLFGSYSVKGDNSANSRWIQGTYFSKAAMC